MRKILMLSAVALLGAACNDVDAPLLEPADGAGFNRGAANAPFVATSLSAAERHTCAVAAGGDLQCWGSNAFGQIGIGVAGGTVATPASVGRDYVQVSVGGFHTCALTGAGTAYCWGRNTLGTLGTGDVVQSNVPVAVETGLRFLSIHAGNQFTCGLTTEGTVYCWGANNVGQLGTETAERCALGTGTQPCSTVPVAVGGGHTFAELEVGLWNGCGLLSTGSALCWGNGNWGQLGTGTFVFRNPSPRAVSGGLSFTELSVGAVHMCGITSSNATYCWGYNEYGQVGHGNRSPYITAPSAVSTGGRTFTTIVASKGNSIFGHTCATDATGVTYCWGTNSSGQLGTAESLPTCGTTGIYAQPCSVTPVAVQTALEFSSFDLGNEYSCAISTSRRAYCWGSNAGGALGNLDVTTTTSEVTPVAGGTRGRAAAGRREPPAHGRITGD